MKMSAGVSHPLIDPDDSPFWPASSPFAPEPLAPEQAPTGPRPAPRSSRRFTTTVAAAATGATLMGCASSVQTPLRVSSAYRLDHSGVSPAQGYLALARQYEGEARPADALDAYRKAAQAAPDDPDILNALGMALAQRAQLAQAVTALSRAVLLAPGRAPLLNNLGYALLLDGRSDEARAVLTEALALDAGHPMARANLDRLGAGPAAATPPLAKSVAEAPPAVAPAAPLPASVASMPALNWVQSLPNAPALSFSLPGRSESGPSADGGPAPLTVATAAPPVAVTIAETVATVATARPDAVAPTALPSATPAAAPDAEPPRVEISNGNGVTGMAAWTGGLLRARGLTRPPRLTNQPRFNLARTVVEYRSGFAAEARSIASHLPHPASLAAAPNETLRGDVRVLLGHDIVAATVCKHSCPVYAERGPAPRLASLTKPH